MRLPIFFLVLTGVALAQEEREIPRKIEKPKAVAPPSALLLQGVVRDATTKEPLPGAYVRVKGTLSGTVSGPDGSFRLSVVGSLPVVLEVSYVGYETGEVQVASSQGIEVLLKEGGLAMKEVVISTSRVPEAVLEAPVTVSRLGIRELQVAPAANLFQQLATAKNVDVHYHSITFPVINTRGFGGPGNPRFVQRVDGIEMIAPVFGFPVGLLSAPPEVDLERMELTAGPASALYGPNAFNGMLDMYSRSPRQYPGFSAAVRLGANHFASELSPRPYFQLSGRYAQTLFERFSFKVAAEYLRATDWLATDYRDEGTYAGADPQYTIPGRQNPGYNGVNTYGDEVRVLNAALGSLPQLFGIRERFYLARTGYRDRDLISPEVFFQKYVAQLHYFFSDNLELSWRSFISNGNTIYQAANRNVLRDVFFHQHKVELRGRRFFIRSYGSWESSGRSYDSRFTAIYLNQWAKPDAAWFVLYHEGYAIYGSHEAARIYADTVTQPSSTYAFIASQAGLPRGPFRRRLEPGDPEFNRVKEEINSGYIRINRQAGFYDRSSFYHAEAQYDLSDFTRRLVEILVGGNVRLFRVNTRGTLFSDFEEPLWVREYGGFIQANRWLFNRRLRLLGSIRYDKSQYFQGRFTPRAAILFGFGKERQHNFRLSYQTGFRIPTLQDQFISLDIGFRIITLGGISRTRSIFGADRFAFDPVSVQAYRRAAQGIQGEDTLAQLAQQYLVKRVLDPLRPEFTQQYEVGGRFQLLRGLYIDVEYARAVYRDFVLYRRIVGPEPIYEANSTRPRSLTNIDPTTSEGLINLRDGRYYEYSTATNYTESVYADYASAGIEYAITPKIFWTASYSYAQLVLRGRADPSLLPSFNTPRHKVGASLYLTNFGRWGGAINYRWIDAFTMDGIIEGPVPASQWVDVQVSYSVPKWKTVFRLGGQNVLNVRYVQLPGGPRVGGLYYFQVVYDPFLR
ncbi:MAG: TonB-dependent receptor [Bacteroidia bacterium]|nr:TonB-dependent receptor [Bacteroidia bacterium]